MIREKDDQNSPVCQYSKSQSGLTMRLATMRSSFSVFGITAVPLCTPQLNTTCAAVPPYFSPILLKNTSVRSGELAPPPRG